MHCLNKIQRVPLNLIAVNRIIRLIRYNIKTPNHFLYMYLSATGFAYIWNNLYSLSAIMIYFSKYLPYYMSNAQLKEEPLEQSNYSDKNSAQCTNSIYATFFILLFCFSMNIIFGIIIN